MAKIDGRKNEYVKDDSSIYDPWEAVSLEDLCFTE